MTEIRTKILTLALVCLVALSLPLAAGDERDEREVLIERLGKSREMFLESVHGLTEAQFAYKPAPDRWSIAEVAEHIAASEGMIQGSVVASLEAPAAADMLADAAKDEMVVTMMLDRDTKFSAPEPLVPTGRFASMEETIATFVDGREAAIKLVGDAGDLRGHAAEHPGFGNLDAHGWLLFLSAHCERHTLQIDEVKADPGFPKG